MRCYPEERLTVVTGMRLCITANHSNITRNNCISPYFLFPLPHLPLPQLNWLSFPLTSVGQPTRPPVLRSSHSPSCSPVDVGNSFSIGPWQQRVAHDSFSSHRKWNHYRCSSVCFVAEGQMILTTPSPVVAVAPESVLSFD